MKTTPEELEAKLDELVEEFHKARIKKTGTLKLSDVIKKKNPYLFKAKGLNSVAEIVKSLLDATISSSEETMFGETMEKLAIFICQKEKGGWKSGCEGIDLEFSENDGNTRYLISIKSGPNWGNSNQINRMKDEFTKARRTLRTNNQDPRFNIICVNGCCYGKDSNPDKGDYFKYCGQEFWELISGNPNFYKDILEPFEKNAKEQNAQFEEEYQKVINKFSGEFCNKYCKEDGSIDWDKILEENSAKTVKAPKNDGSVVSFTVESGPSRSQEKPVSPTTAEYEAIKNYNSD